jgi:histidine ammonia-lyase
LTALASLAAHNRIDKQGRKKPMTVLINSREDFTLANYQRVAWGKEAVDLSPECWRKIGEGRQGLLQYAETHGDEPIYGVTTGFGDLARALLGSEQREAQAHWKGHHRGIGIGEPYPERLVRGIVFARLANFVDGQSGVSADLVREVAAMLRDSTLPAVRAQGQQSSGEVNLLLELFGHILGERRGVKEANSLTNGSPASSAMAADAAIRARSRLRLVDQVMALVIAAGGGPLSPYDQAIAVLWADGNDRAALHRLAPLLTSLPVTERQIFQPPVSWRIIPRMLGATYRAAGILSEVAKTSLQSNTDNPVYIMAADSRVSGRVLPTGGFHNAAVCPALDGMNRSWADLATLTGRHLAVLGKDMLSFERELSLYGLTGFHAYHVRKAREAAAPTFLLAEDTFSAQTDVMLPAMYAYEKETQTGHALACCLAATAAAASQCLWHRGVSVEGELGHLLKEVRDRCPPGGHLRSQGTEMQRVIELFESFQPAE